MGRPLGSVNEKEIVRYSKKIFKEICDKIATGQSLRRACSEPQYPTPAAVIKWVMDDHDGCSKQYENARIIQAALYADEIVDIADDGHNDTYTKDLGEGATAVVVNTDVVQRSRLRVDSRKWILSKVLPKVYGDKLDLNHAGNVGVSLTGVSLLLEAARTGGDSAVADGPPEAEPEASL